MCSISCCRELCGYGADAIAEQEPESMPERAEAISSVAQEPIDTNARIDRSVSMDARIFIDDDAELPTDEELSCCGDQGCFVYCCSEGCFLETDSCIEVIIDIAFECFGCIESSIYVLNENTLNLSSFVDGFLGN